MLCSRAAADTGMASPTNALKRMSPKFTQRPKTELLGVILQRCNFLFIGMVRAAMTMQWFRTGLQTFRADLQT